MRLTIEIVLLVLATPTILLVGIAARDAYRGYDSEYLNPLRPSWKTLYNRACSYGQVDLTAEEANKAEYESLRDKLAKVANVRGAYIRAKLSGAAKGNRS